MTGIQKKSVVYSQWFTLGNAAHLKRLYLYVGYFKIPVNTNGSVPGGL